MNDELKVSVYTGDCRRRLPVYGNRDRLGRFVRVRHAFWFDPLRHTVARTGHRYFNQLQIRVEIRSS
jgi:hypothetical protein